MTLQFFHQRWFAGLIVTLLFSAGIIGAVLLTPHTSAIELFDDAAKVSPADHQIYFIKDTKSPKGNTLLWQVYSVYSNGGGERLEEAAPSNEWQIASEQYGAVQNSAKEYTGTLVSPNGKNTLYTTPSRPFLPVWKGQRVWVAREKEPAYELPFVPKEIEWLSDSNRLLFVYKGELFILDTQQKRYAKIANAEGKIFIK